MRSLMLAANLLTNLAAEVPSLERNHLTITSPAGVPRGDFGTSVAVWEGLVLVGAPKVSNLRGAVFIFDATDGSPVATLHPSEGLNSAGFGKALVIHDDMLLVGAWIEGAGYLFDLRNLSLVEKFEPNPSGSRSGWAVGLSSNHAVIGNYVGSSGVVRSGSAFLFDSTSGRQVAQLAPSPATDDADFGWAVATAGGGVIVGAHGETEDGVRNAGAAYIFQNQGGLQPRRLAPSVANSSTFGLSFGNAVAASDDRFVISSYRDDDVGVDRGAIYLGSFADPESLRKVTHPDPSTIFFGRSLAFIGNDVLVGADGTIVDGNPSAGAAFLIDFRTGDILSGFRANDGRAYDEFGSSVAISGSYVVVGAPKADFRSQGQDSVCVFARTSAVKAEVIGKPTINRQTGLLEQSIQITNTSSIGIEGFRLAIDALPEEVVLVNAMKPDGTLEIRRRIDAGESFQLVLEFYSPTRFSSFELSLEAEKAEVSPHSTTDKPGTSTPRCTFLEDGSLLLEFSSSPGKRHEIHYSDDGEDWKISPVPIHSASNRVQWIDRGPPRTDSPPSDKSSRFYRVREISEPAE